MPSIIERVNATQHTINDFLFSAFEWGECDCAHLVTAHLKHFDRETRLSEAGNYSTELGAKRAMKRLGAKCLEDFLDGMGFERIPVASAVAGDVIGLPGGTNEHPWTALGVHTGDRILAFADSGSGTRCEWGPIYICTVAWRVI
jgi:hypothetical protein